MDVASCLAVMATVGGEQHPTRYGELVRVLHAPKLVALSRHALSNAGLLK